MDTRERRLEILRLMIAAAEGFDDDGYAEAYDELLAFEKEAGEFDGPEDDEDDEDQ